MAAHHRPAGTRTRRPAFDGDGTQPMDEVPQSQDAGPGAPELPAAVCRWAARISATAFCAFIVMIAVGEGMPNPLSQPLEVQLGFVGLGAMMLGFMAGWVWELAGGILSLAGIGLFCAVVARLSPSRMNWFILSLLAPGALYLASFLLRRLAGRSMRA